MNLKEEIEKDGVEDEKDQKEVKKDKKEDVKEKEKEIFDFSETFSKKINNLKLILELYKVDPLRSIEKLNKIYNYYSSFLSKKNNIINKKKK